MDTEYHRKHTAHRITLQVAVEAIVNHPGDGYDVETMAAVLADARDAQVPALYTDMLAELLALACVCCGSRLARPAPTKPLAGCGH